MNIPTKNHMEYFYWLAQLVNKIGVKYIYGYNISVKPQGTCVQRPPRATTHRNQYFCLLFKKSQRNNGITRKEDFGCIKENSLTYLQCVKSYNYEVPATQPLRQATNLIAEIPFRSAAVFLPLPKTVWKSNLNDVYCTCPRHSLDSVGNIQLHVSQWLLYKSPTTIRILWKHST